MNKITTIHELATCDLDLLLENLATDTNGLTSTEADQRLDEWGHNVIQTKKQLPWPLKFLGAFINPFNIVLLIIAAVSFTTDVLLVAPAEREYITVSIILAMVFASGLIKYISETRSNDAAEKLQDLVETSATVLRDGIWREEPLDTIVPGDVIRLSAGDMLPADVRLLSAKDLFVSQSSLTGESEPVEKRPATGFDNMCFMGTSVVSGSATAIVVTTGNRTRLASVAAALMKKREKTSFELGIDHVSRMLLRMMILMVPIIFVVNGWAKNDWTGALLFALSVAVGLTPEMLPMILTTTLAKGALTMAKHKTIVKNLSSIQNFGAMDVLCTDKTGTITEDRIVLETYLDIHGQPEPRVLRHAYLNSRFQTGLKNLLDLAVIERAQQVGLEGKCDHFRKIDEIPFDFERRRMSVVLTNGNGKRQLITKGAVEEMLAISSLAEYHGKVIPLTDEIRQEVTARANQLNDQGLRVIAVAQKNHVHDVDIFGVADENNMVLMGFIGFLDPPKESSKAAISTLQEHGVRVIVLTGDNDRVARKICSDVGLNVDEIIIGDQVEQMSDALLAECANRVAVFAKLSPLQKARVVRALQAQGHTVGFMGDGINDAPAMHQADIGISVDTAVDIAKETADIILLEKSLLVLGEGVIEGRRTFGNIVKYVNMAASSNFGNMFSVLAASLFLPFLPMLPLHILVQNLLYDFSQFTIPSDNMDEDFLSEPQKWDPENMQRFMLIIGPISSIFDIVTYLVMWFVFAANTPAMAAVFQTGWFIEGLISQTLIVHLIRTRKVPFIESRASRPLLLSTVLVIILGTALPWTAAGAALGLVQLPVNYFAWLLGILLAYGTLTQYVKNWYIGRYKEWL